MINSKISDRILEIFPGALTWTALALPILLSIFWPKAAGYFIILYTVFWFLRVFIFTFHLVKSYAVFKKYSRIPWAKLLGLFSYNKGVFKNLAKEIPNRKKYFKKIHKKISELKKNRKFKIFANLKHIVILATYKESIDVLRSSVFSIQKSCYDAKKIIFVLATEERDKINAQKNADILKKEFKGVFNSFYHFMHPKNIKNEIIGKGSNISWAGRKIAKIMKRKKENFSNILVTTLDADNRVHPYYFLVLAFFYLIDPNRSKKSYQPLPFFYNNIWDVPLLNRMVAVSSSFWHMIESGRPDRLRNFSAHAQSLDALKKTDFWAADTIVEDGRQFWRSYFSFNGDHKVIPLFVPIYQDAVQGRTYFKTFASQYRQLRRWAWGASDIPYVAKNMWKNRKTIPVWKNIVYLFRLIEGHFMWATAPIIVTLAHPLPKLVNSAFGETIFAFNLGYILSRFFSISLIGIFISFLISVLVVPRPPSGLKYKIGNMLQWLFLPAVTIIFGAIPAIDAQTRLMFGEKLEFQVTEKIRRK